MINNNIHIKEIKNKYDINNSLNNINEKIDKLNKTNLNKNKVLLDKNNLLKDKLRKIIIEKKSLKCSLDKVNNNLKKVDYSFDINLDYENDNYYRIKEKHINNIFQTIFNEINSDSFQKKIINLIQSNNMSIGDKIKNFQDFFFSFSKKLKIYFDNSKEKSKKHEDINEFCLSDSNDKLDIKNNITHKFIYESKNLNIPEHFNNIIKISQSIDFDDILNENKVNLNEILENSFSSNISSNNNKIIFNSFNIDERP